jgi:hypothetical protein
MLIAKFIHASKKPKNKFHALIGIIIVSEVAGFEL